MHIYSPREVQTNFNNILVTHVLPIDFNVEFQVQLLLNNNQYLKNLFRGVYLVDNTFKMLP